MIRTSLCSAALATMLAAMAVSSTSLRAQQTSQYRKAIQADGAASSTEAKEVKRLNEAAAQAGARTRQMHQAYLQKVTARETAVKSYGGKDSRTEQAYKDEAAAKQEWVASIKNQQEVDAQRKAAIDKLHADAMKHNQDVGNLEKDGQKKSTSSAPKQ